jgi:hypothetical protein
LTQILRWRWKVVNHSSYRLHFFRKVLGYSHIFWMHRIKNVRYLWSRESSSFHSLPIFFLKKYETFLLFGLLLLWFDRFKYDFALRITGSLVKPLISNGLGEHLQLTLSLSSLIGLACSLSLLPKIHADDVF